MIKKLLQRWKWKRAIGRSKKSDHLTTIYKKQINQFGTSRYKLMEELLKPDEIMKLYDDTFYRCIEITVIKGDKRSVLDIPYMVLAGTDVQFELNVFPRFEKMLKELRGGRSMNDVLIQIYHEINSKWWINRKQPTVIIVSTKIFNGLKRMNESIVNWNPNEYALFGIRLKEADINGFIVGELIECEVKENE
jgi:hypothetical protein